MSDEKNIISIKLLGKIFIRGKIKALTGLHIGGGQSALNIGGIDNSVIKDSMDRPYIPGSTLKGKMRCLLERKEELPSDLLTENKVNSKYEKEYTKQGIKKTGDLAKIFGRGADDDYREAGLTRFYARDAYLNEKSAGIMKGKKERFKDLEFDYTESKWENVIDRITSKAEHPRLVERVPRGAEFDFEFIYNVFDEKDIGLFEKIIQGMQLLEDDYIGGSGSRGYGQIEIIPEKAFIKTVKNYEEGKTGEDNSFLEMLMSKDSGKITKEIKKKFNGNE